jgi:hypothetical protein
MTVFTFYDTSSRLPHSHLAAVHYVIGTPLIEKAPVSSTGEPAIGYAASGCSTSACIQHGHIRGVACIARVLGTSTSYEPSLSKFFATYCRKSLVQHLEKEPVAFVSELRARWEQQTVARRRETMGVPIPPAPDPPTIFISYMREDADAARRLRDAIIELGGDVWPGMRTRARMALVLDVFRRDSSAMRPGSTRRPEPTAEAGLTGVDELLRSAQGRRRGFAHRAPTAYRTAPSHRRCSSRTTQQVVSPPDRYRASVRAAIRTRPTAAHRRTRL